MAMEFSKPAGRAELSMPPPHPFPEAGLPEEEVLASVREALTSNPYRTEDNFGLSYVGPPHPIAAAAADLARETVFVEWAEDMFPGTYRLEKEAVRMMASLLGAPDGVGFITSGGTESNMSALRLARDIAGASDPEVVMPESAHYSFRLGAELLGMRVREIPIGDDLRPRMSEVESLINRDTVALVCSAPEGDFGIIDPVEEFSEIAVRRGIYLHVDGAFGGFILPFMRDLGIDVPPFDFALPGVTSIMTDGHKLGLLPVATGFFLVRDTSVLGAIPTEETLIHTLTATKPGTHAAAAWAVMKRLGREGYMARVRQTLDLVEHVADGIAAVDGVRLVCDPFITLVNFTSTGDVDLARVYAGLRRRGWGTTYGVVRGIPHIRLSIHHHRDMEHADRFLRALAESVREA
jgi:tyrosine decarboxylase / aspartate 1-decarboxylase